MNNEIYDTKIIYFAGADSTAQNRLIQELQKLFNQDTLYCFYGFQDEEPAHFIQHVINKMDQFLGDEKDIFFIGQSYGGYFANYFGEGNYNNIPSPTFLINPMIFPKNSNRFKNKNLAISTDRSRSYKAIFLSENDKIVPPEPTRDFFNQSNSVRQIFTLKNETHRIKDLSPILKHIIHYYNNIQEG